MRLILGMSCESRSAFSRATRCFPLITIPIACETKMQFRMFKVDCRGKR